jgi:hypothetical protein
VAVKINEYFQKLIEYLVEHEKKVGEAAETQSAGKPRPWMDFSQDPLSVKAEKKAENEDGLHPVFSREDSGLNQEYIDARSNDKSKTNEVAVSKLSGDFMAAMERDKRMQWRGRIRMVAHAAARRAGNGLDKGPLRRHTLDYLSRIFLKAEEKKPNG